MRFSKTLKKVIETRPNAQEIERGSISTEGGVNETSSNESAQFAVHELKFGRPATDFPEQAGRHAEAVAAPPHIQRYGVPAEVNPDKGSKEARISGAFPSLVISPVSVHERLVAIREPDSSYAEDYRSLRTQLIHKKNETGVRSIVLLSFGPGEGKSVTAINLAWLLAQTDGIKAALIDGDLRQPSIAEYLGQHDSFGLAELMRNGNSFEDAMTVLEPAGLHFIPGGATREDVAELISSSKFRDLHDTLVERFDFTIIDAPPLSLFTDAAAMLEVADAGILVIRANQVNYQALDRMMRTLPKEKLLAVVLNQSEEALIDRDYYYYANSRSSRM